MKNIKLSLESILLTLFLAFRVYLLHLVLLVTFIGMIIFMTVLGDIEPKYFVLTTLKLIKSFYYSGTTLGISNLRWHMSFFSLCCLFILLEKR